MYPLSLLVTVTLVTTLSLVECLLTVKPSAVTVALVGERITMRCSTDSTEAPVCWSHKPVGKTTYTRTLFVNDKIRVQRCDIQRSTSTAVGNDTSPRAGRAFDLVIRSVEAQDAGMYMCRDHNNRGHDNGVAELIVFQSDSFTCLPSNDSTDRDTATLTCGVEYIGASNTSSLQYLVGFRWSDAAGDHVTVSNESRIERSVTSNNTVNRRVLESTAIVSTVSRECCYKCMLTPAMTGNTNWTVTRGCGWPITTMNVFPVRNVRIEPRFVGTALVGDNIACEADGEPRPEYSWTELPTGLVTSTGPELTLTETGNHEYRCTAKNVVQNITYVESADFKLSVTVVTVGHVPDESPDNQSSSSVIRGDEEIVLVALEHPDGDKLTPALTVVAAIIGFALFVAVGLIVAVFVVRFCRRRKLRIQAEAAIIAAETSARLEMVNSDVNADGFRSSLPRGRAAIPIGPTKGPTVYETLRPAELTSSYAVVADGGCEPHLYEPLRQS